MAMTHLSGNDNQLIDILLICPLPYLNAVSYNGTSKI